MTQTPQTPPGWYPQGDVQRWWDGNAWTEHTHPLPQPTVPQPYQAPQPLKKSNTTRNVLIIFGVLFLALVGGCFAVGAVLVNRANDTINDDSLGGPNNPLTITPGEGFEVNGFEYADGWTVSADPGGTVSVQGLKVTNNRGKADRAVVEIRLLLRNEILATASCNNDLDKIPEGTTVTLTCSSSDTMPAEYDKVTISDAF